MTEAPDPPWKPTLRQEWILVAVACAVFVLLVAFEPVAFPKAATEEEHNPISIAGMLLNAFAHVGWISMDRKRRGREVGAWRFLTLFFGPLALWVYLALEYRGRAFVLIPLSIGIYVLTIGLGLVGAAFLS